MSNTILKNRADAEGAKAGKFLRGLRVSTVKILFCCCAVFFLTACEQKFTAANLEKVEQGMTPAEVEQLIGEPTRVETQDIPMLKSTVYTYETGESSVKIVFLNDKLISKTGTISD